jgi:3-hydroxyisobutyrate dehydrogenase
VTTTNAGERIAFIGLGTMGQPMARRLAEAGHALSLFDIDAALAQRLAQEFGATAAASPVEAARGASIVITMLPSSKEVDATILGVAGAPGVVSVLAPGSFVIDMSSSDPMRTRALADAVAKTGSTLVDAPVSGAVRRARDGSLSIMFGGAEAALERLRPVLSAMGTQIFHVGAEGAGHAMKALNNYVSAAGLVAAVEALHVGEKFGIDPAVMTKVFNASTGKNNTTENKVAQFMLSGKYDSGFLLALMAKDVGIAIGLADTLGIDAPLGHVCADLWREAASTSPRTTDHTEMYHLLRD